jgi:hypothetical protein
MNLEPALRSRLTNVARLALHSATPEKEWQAAAIAFFRSLRTAKIPAELLVNGETGNIKNPVPPTSPDYKGGPKPYFFPYGKYKNVPIDQVDEGPHDHPRSADAQIQAAVGW